MNGRFWAATLAGLVLANLIDWLFAGVLFHDRYQAHPEIWRVKGANPRALIGAQAMTLPTVVGLIAVMIWTGQVSLAGSLILAVFIWAIAAAPPIIANALYIKIDPLVTLSHTIGWLVKLAAVGACASFILRP